MLARLSLSGVTRYRSRPSGRRRCWWRCFRRWRWAPRRSRVLRRTRSSLPIRRSSRRQGCRSTTPRTLRRTCRGKSRSRWLPNGSSWLARLLGSRSQMARSGSRCWASTIDARQRGVDTTQSSTAADQYASRHNPFVYFHSVIDDAASCRAHVLPLATHKKGLAAIVALVLLFLTVAGRRQRTVESALVLGLTRRDPAASREGGLAAGSGLAGGDP